MLFTVSRFHGLHSLQKLLIHSQIVLDCFKSKSRTVVCQKKETIVYNETDKFKEACNNSGHSCWKTRQYYVLDCMDPAYYNHEDFNIGFKISVRSQNIDQIREGMNQFCWWVVFEISQKNFDIFLVVCYMFAWSAFNALKKMTLHAAKVPRLHKTLRSSWMISSNCQTLLIVQELEVMISWIVQILLWSRQLKEIWSCHQCS